MEASRKNLAVQKFKLLECTQSNTCLKLSGEIYNVIGTYNVLVQSPALENPLKRAFNKVFGNKVYLSIMMRYNCNIAKLSLRDSEIGDTVRKAFALRIPLNCCEHTVHPKENIIVDDDYVAPTNLNQKMHLIMCIAREGTVEDYIRLKKLIDFQKLNFRERRNLICEAAGGKNFEIFKRISNDLDISTDEYVSAFSRSFCEGDLNITRYILSRNKFIMRFNMHGFASMVKDTLFTQECPNFVNFVIKNWFEITGVKLDVDICKDILKESLISAAKTRGCDNIDIIYENCKVLRVILEVNLPGLKLQSVLFKHVQFLIDKYHRNEGFLKLILLDLKGKIRKEQYISWLKYCVNPDGFSSGRAFFILLSCSKQVIGEEISLFYKDALFLRSVNRTDSTFYENLGSFIEDHDLDHDLAAKYLDLMTEYDPYYY